MPSEFKVAIVGCGISGLCLAQGLKLKGIDFSLYERDPSRETRNQGYRITVDENGLKALEACLPKHLFDLVEATAGEPGGFFRFLRGDLREIYSLDFTPKPGVSNKYLGRQIDRSVLREILFAGLEENISFGKACTRVEDHADHAILYFSDGTSVSADLVVGADGASSLVRKAVGQGDPEALKAFAIYGRTITREGLIPAGLENSGVLAIGPPGKAFFFATMRFRELPQEAFPRFGMDGTRVVKEPYIMWAIAVSASDPYFSQSDRNLNSLQKIANGLMDGFDPVLRRFVLEAEPDDTLLLPLRVSANTSQWTSPHLTLMGDAAHLMPPFGAHGGNTALRDAALLTAWIDADSSVAVLRSRLNHYQQEVLKYGSKQVKSASSMMRATLSDNWVLRFILLSVLPRLRPRSTRFMTDHKLQALN
jgi:2-polyprenyl-6-methoxyphenol hydroxylase-like FAD-dependent oxidoreductase